MSAEICSGHKTESRLMTLGGMLLMVSFSEIGRL